MIKCVLCKHEDLSSNPQYTHIISDVTPHICKILWPLWGRKQLNSFYGMVPKSSLFWASPLFFFERQTLWPLFNICCFCRDKECIHQLLCWKKLGAEISTGTQMRKVRPHRADVLLPPGCSRLPETKSETTIPHLNNSVFTFGSEYPGGKGKYLKRKKKLKGREKHCKSQIKRAMEPPDTVLL